VPLPRKWIPVDTSVANRNGDPIFIEPKQNVNSVLSMPALFYAAGGIKVISYNVLNEAYATHQMYPYCPSWALDWKHRKNQVLRQVLAHDADIIALQVTL